jgi:flagellar biosynthesis/type III secretory pathway protein FliH
MALIKQANWSPGNRDAVVLRLGDLKDRAALLEREATTQAAKIIADARAERERLVAGARERGLAEGHAKGYADGHAKGLAEGRHEGVNEIKPRLQDIEARWMAGAAEFEIARERMLDEARRDLLRLSLRIAERVIKGRIETDPGIAAAQIESVLGMIMNPTRLAIVINPDDEPALKDAMPSLMARFAAATHMGMTTDPALPRGSCLARTSGGEIDATIWTQLDRISETLLAGGLTSDATPMERDEPGDGKGGAA